MVIVIRWSTDERGAQPRLASKRVRALPKLRARDPTRVASARMRVLRELRNRSTNARGTLGILAHCVALPGGLRLVARGVHLRTPRRFVFLIPCVVTALAAADSPPAHGQPRGAAVDIPFEQFTLPNGLRVLVHTDRKVPIVAVNIWYHVGSKSEPRGRSGFAHLFEHLMFQGSENHKGEFFEPFELVGATDQNGTTNTDRTNYFENVPTTALDVALWMESDRMGHLLGALDQKLLDE